jgi:hypothetical protein
MVIISSVVMSRIEWLVLFLYTYFTSISIIEIDSRATSESHYRVHTCTRSIYSYIRYIRVRARDRAGARVRIRVKG